MGRIEKTVFISYRRSNVPWALAISQNLTHKKFDVFFDFVSINSGDFEQIITENIQARAHFLILLTPSALERCNEPNDWFRREIEMALDYERNIVPVLLEGFDFGAKATLNYLTGKLENIRKYNGLTLHAEYFEAGMEKLCNRFLSIPLDKVLHPVSSNTQQIVNEQKRAVAEQAPVDEKVLSAQEWSERAYISKLAEDKIRLYTKAIELDPKLSFAYNNRGISYSKLKQYKKAFEDFDQAIKLNPEFAEPYINRGTSYAKLEQYEKAFEDFDQAIKLNPEYVEVYYNRGTSYSELEQYEKAIEDFGQAIKLNPEYVEVYYNRGTSYSELEQYEKAIEDFDQAIKLNPEYGLPSYNKACIYALQGNVEEASKCLLQALKINSQIYCELLSNDSDFDIIRGDAKFKNLLKEFCDKC